MPQEQDLHSDLSMRPQRSQEEQHETMAVSLHRNGRPLRDVKTFDKYKNHQALINYTSYIIKDQVILKNTSVRLKQGMVSMNRLNEKLI